MDNDPQKPAGQSQPAYAYTWVYFLAHVVFIIGGLIVAAGSGIAITGYNAGIIPLGLAVLAVGILFIAMAAALKLLGDIAAKVVYGIQP